MKLLCGKPPLRVDWRGVVAWAPGGPENGLANHAITRPTMEDPQGGHGMAPQQTIGRPILRQCQGSAAAACLFVVLTACPRIRPTRRTHPVSSDAWPSHGSARVHRVAMHEVNQRRTHWICIGGPALRVLGWAPIKGFDGRRLQKRATFQSSQKHDAPDSGSGPYTSPVWLRWRHAGADSEGHASGLIGQICPRPRNLLYRLNCCPTQKGGVGSDSRA